MLPPYAAVGNRTRVCKDALQSEQYCRHSNIRPYFVGFAVDLFQVVFVLLDFSFVVFDGFEVGVDDGSGFDFF